MKAEIREHILPAFAIGTQRVVRSIHFRPVGASRKVYIQAGLHADEAPGMVVAWRLLELLEEAAGRDAILEEIVVVPVANPIGLSQWNIDTVEGRFAHCDQVNFNRRYPDLVEELAQRLADTLGQDAAENIRLIRDTAKTALDAQQPLGEAESLKQLLLGMAIDADIVLDLHCDNQALLHVYMGTPLWPAARDLSAQLGAEVTLLALESGDNPFDEASSRLWWALAEKFPGVPIPPACLSATVELRGQADTDPAVIDQDAANLYAFLQRRGYLAGRPPALPELKAEATPLEGVDYIKAAAPGLLTFVRTVGETVKKGELLAQLRRPPTGGEGLATVVDEVRSETDGLFFARCCDRFARPGKVVAKVAGCQPLAGKGVNLLTS